MTSLHGRKSKMVHNDELANTKHKLREAEQERDSLRTTIKILN